MEVRSSRERMSKSIFSKTPVPGERSFSQAHSLFFSLPHIIFLSCSLSHTFSYSYSCSHTHTLSHTFAISLTLSLSLSHSLFWFRVLEVKIIARLLLPKSLSLSLYLTHTHTHATITRTTHVAHHIFDFAFFDWSMWILPHVIKQIDARWQHRPVLDAGQLALRSKDHPSSDVSAHAS